MNYKDNKKIMMININKINIINNNNNNNNNNQMQQLLLIKNIAIIYKSISTSKLYIHKALNP